MRKMDHVYTSTMWGRPDRWNAELWSRVYGFKQGGEGMTTKRNDCTRDKFSQRLDPKYGYFVKDYKDERKRRMLAFIVSIFSPKKPYNITLTLAKPCFLHIPKNNMVDWRSIIGELVHKLATNTKRGQPSYIGPFIFHIYAHDKNSGCRGRRWNQHAEEVDHVEDIMTITALPVSTTEVVVPDATPVGKETLDN